MILGPCAIENEDIAMETARILKEIETRIKKRFKDFEIIYKSSYSKANRTKGSSFHGVGIDKGLQILKKVRETYGLRVTSDVHTVEEAQQAGEVLDIIQIPHALCRITKLIQAAANTKKIVSIKKGSFVSPEDMQHIVQKIRETGNDNDVIIIERGNNFGYNDTIVDMRNFNIFNEISGNVVTCIDGSHPVTKSQDIPPITRAGVSAGADMVFIETHPFPTLAPCDGHRMYPLGKLEHLICQIMRIKGIIDEE